MKRVLVSLVVVASVILAPRGSAPTHSTVIDTSSHTTDPSGLPVVGHDIVVPSASPSATSGSVTPADAVIPAASNEPEAPSDPSGNSGTAVVQGSFTTPEPPTCSGNSMSKSSSENGRWSRSHMEHSNCGDGDSSCDGSPCDE